MKEFLQFLLAIQRRQLRGVVTVQSAIDEVAAAVLNDQQLDAAKLSELTRQLDLDAGDLKAAVKAAESV